MVLNIFVSVFLLFIAVVIYIAPVFFLNRFFTKAKIDQYNLKFLSYDFSVKKWGSLLIPLHFLSPFILILLFSSLELVGIRFFSGELQKNLVNYYYQSIFSALVVLIVTVSTVIDRLNAKSLKS